MKKMDKTTTASATGSWHAMLKAVMLQNQAARITESNPDGSLSLAVPTRRPDYLFPPLSWVIRPPKERITILDPIGAALWRACDGRQTVEDLVVKFAMEHRLSFHESRVSVTGYITSLLQRGALAVAV